MYPLSVLKARGLKPGISWTIVCLKAPGDDLSLLLPSIWCLLAIWGVPWLMTALTPSLPLWSLVLSCVFLWDFNLSLLIRTSVTGFRAHPNPIFSHFNLITSAKTLLIIRSHSLVPGVRTSPWGKHNLTYNENKMSRCLKFTFRCLSKKFYSQRETKKRKKKKVLKC